MIHDPACSNIPPLAHLFLRLRSSVGIHGHLQEHIEAETLIKAAQGSKRKWPCKNQQRGAVVARWPNELSDAGSLGDGRFFSKEVFLNITPFCGNIVSWEGGLVDHTSPCLDFSMFCRS